MYFGIKKNYKRKCIGNKEEWKYQLPNNIPECELRMQLLPK